MTIGYPVKNEWPILDMRNAPDRLFAQLFDAELGYLARKGYRKRGKVKKKRGASSSNIRRLTIIWVSSRPFHRTELSDPSSTPISTRLPLLAPRSE